MMLSQPQNSPRGRRQCPARGITLIETMTVIAASVFLLGAATTALVALYRADQTWSQRADELRSREQLLHKLRRDVHASQGFTWSSAQSTLRLTMADGGELSYQQISGRWERRLKPTGDDNTDAALTSAFPAPASVTWEVTPPQGEVGDLIRVRLMTASDQADIAGDDAPPAAELVAVVGRDWRLLHQ
jgi:hypothetical protein